MGFELVDELVKKLDVGSGKPDIEVGGWRLDKKFKSYILRYAQNDKALLLAKPQTYMNNSGMAVKLLTTYYKLPSTDVIVLHDDLDLPLGKIKVRLGGAAAGHHGVESIIEALGTDQFVRVRLGIGNLKTKFSEHKHAHGSAEKYVLEPFLHSENAPVKHMIKQAIRAIDLLLEKGLPVAQNQFN